MFLPLFIAFLVQGLLLGLVVLALLAAAPKLQKRYGRGGSAACGWRWRCCSSCRFGRFCLRPRRR